MWGWVNKSQEGGGREGWGGGGGKYKPREGVREGWVGGEPPGRSEDIVTQGFWGGCQLSLQLVCFGRSRANSKRFSEAPEPSLEECPQAQKQASKLEMEIITTLVFHVLVARSLLDQCFCVWLGLWCPESNNIWDWEINRRPPTGRQAQSSRK